MGFERLCMVLQNKKSNYDSDIFILLIKQIETLGETSVFDTNIGGAAVEYEFFFSEFVEHNTCIKLFSGLRNIKNKTYTWTHWLVDIENKKVLAIANSVIVAMDLQNRKSVQIPHKMKTSLENIVLK